MIREIVCEAMFCFSWKRDDGLPVDDKRIAQLRKQEKRIYVQMSQGLTKGMFDKTFKEKGKATRYVCNWEFTASQSNHDDFWIASN